MTTTKRLATGETPKGLYNRLIEAHEKWELNFSKFTAFNLGEYVGLPPDQEQSYAHYMGATLFDHVNVTESQAHIPHGMASDVDGHITAMSPASMVQMHRFGHVIIDAAAASELDYRHHHGIIEPKEEPL